MLEWPPWKLHGCKAMSAVSLTVKFTVVGNGGALLDVPITSWANSMTFHLKVSQFTISQSASVLKALVMEQQKVEKVVGVMEPGGDKAWLVPSMVSSEFESDLGNQQQVVFVIKLCSCALDFSVWTSPYLPCGG